ncbi:MAG: transcriptional regulator [Acidobacteriota bacterium]
MSQKRIRPIHPGEILRDELEERGISLNQLSRATRIPLSRVSLVANAKRRDHGGYGYAAWAVFRHLRVYVDGLQADYELQAAADNAARIEREVIPAGQTAA